MSIAPRESKAAEAQDVPGPEVRRTRGGWIPTGVAADRRSVHAERATARGVRSKNQIIDAAQRVFERVGYIDATVEDIVGEAGVARGSFYTYFPSKLEVFYVIEGRVDEEVQAAVSATSHRAGEDLVTNLRAGNQRFIEAYRNNAAMIGLVEQMATFNDGIRERRVQSRQRHVDRVTRAIKRWQAAGIADPAVDASIASAALVSMLANFCYWWFVGGAEFDMELATDTLTDCWVRSLGLHA